MYGVEGCATHIVNESLAAEHIREEAGRILHAEGALGLRLPHESASLPEILSWRTYHGLAMLVIDDSQVLRDDL